MKLSHLIALAAGIVLIHITIILLVTNGGCSGGKPEKLPEKKGGDTSAQTVSGERISAVPGKYPPADKNDVKPVVPGEKKKTSGPEGKVPVNFPDEGPVPAGKSAAQTAKGDAAGEKVETFGQLPPPRAGKGVLNRGPYDWKYVVNGKISAIPTLSGATTGILLHVNSRRILWAKNPHQKVSIASLSKIMTVFLACEDVESGRILLRSRIGATNEAMSLREGVVWMRRGEAFTLRSLLEAAVVRSANDAALLLAQYLGNGDSASFVARMNSTAKSLNMADTKFYNPHGLPGTKGVPDNTSTPEDLLKLSEYAMTNPLFRELVAIRHAGFRTKGEKGYLDMWNHNHLLPGGTYGVNGVKGIKTGYTRKAGFCVAVACERDGQEFIAVVTGFPTSKERDSSMRSLLQWGFIRAKDPRIPEDRIVLKSNVRKKTSFKSGPVKSKAVPKKKSSKGSAQKK